jgi:hypothetical protein
MGEFWGRYERKVCKGMESIRGKGEIRKRDGSRGQDEGKVFEGVESRRGKGEYDRKGE